MNLTNLQRRLVVLQKQKQRLLDRKCNGSIYDPAINDTLNKIKQHGG